jgi:transposase
MGNVLRMDKKRVIEGMIGLGWSDRRIQRETHVHRITIAKYRKALQNRPQVPAGFSAEKEQNDPQLPTGSDADVPGLSVQVEPALPPPRNGSLIPHLAAIKVGLTQGLSAQRIYQDLVEDAAFRGSYDSIKRYIRKVRKKAPQFFERLPVFPGREAQVDFSQGPLIGDGLKKRRSWLFKMTLSFSRHAYEELVYAQDVETFLRCHEHAFAFFGGIPEFVKIDNLKSGVLRAHLYEPILNPVYLAFSEWNSFVINPCDPYQPQQKGRVERDIAYTQSNALKGRKLQSLEEGNKLLFHWNKRWARLRIHGTTKRQVWSQFIEFEKPCLRPLPAAAFPFFKVGRRKVDVQGHIEVNGNFYSAPYHLIGTYVSVHFNSESVVILAGEAVLCKHRTRQGKALASSLPDHRPPHRPVSLEAEEHMHLQRAKTVGPDLHRLIDKLLSREDVGAIKKVRGLMSLRKSFPAALLEDAAGIALTRHNISYHFVKSLCESLRQNEGNTQETLTEEHELIRPLAEYQTHFNQRMN